MKKTLFLNTFMVTTVLLGALIGLAACGIPLVPTESQVQNIKLYNKMQLLSEVALQGLDPNLPENTKGPEMDLIPVMIPVPEALGQRSWLVFPSGQDTNGHNIVSIDYQGLYGGGWAFGIVVSPGKTRHFIAASDQFNSVSRLRFQLPGPGLPYSNLQAFPVNENPSRLAVITQGYDIYTVNPRMYISEFPTYSLTEGGNPIAGGGSTIMGMGENFFPYYDFSPPAAYVTSSSSIGVGFSYSIVAATQLPDRTGAHLFDFSSSKINGYNLNPGSIIDPTAITINSTVTQNVSASYNHFSYSTFFPATPFFTLSSYSSTSGIILASGTSSSIAEAATAIPIVRTLQDGTLLGLSHGQWIKVLGIDPITGIPTGYGQPINTGTLVFVYDYTDANLTKWMVFSEALVVPHLNSELKSDNYLVMRNWQIKQTDLIP